MRRPLQLSGQVLRVFYLQQLISYRLLPVKVEKAPLLRLQEEKTRQIDVLGFEYCEDTWMVVMLLKNQSNYTPIV